MKNNQSFKMIIEARFRSSEGTVLTGKVMSGKIAIGDYVRLVAEDMKVLSSAKIINCDLIPDSASIVATVLVDEEHFLDIAQKGMMLSGVSTNETTLLLKPFKMRITDILFNRPRYMILWGEVVQGRIHAPTQLNIMRGDDIVFSFNRYFFVKGVKAKKETYADVGEQIDILSTQFFYDVKDTDFVTIDMSGEANK